MSSEASKIQLDGVTMAYGSPIGGTVALDNLSLTVRDKEFVSLLGPSGCGKSTLLHLIAGFISPSIGSVKVDDQIVRGPGSDRGMVFQRHNLFPWMTVKENIAFGPRVRKVAEPERSISVSRYLKLMGLEQFAESYPAELSEGMQQRAGVARAFVNKPPVLLMDEPFASLDALTTLRMQELLLRIWTNEKNTIVFVTHDVNEAILLSDRVVLLSARPGRVQHEYPVTLRRPRQADTSFEKEYLELKKEIMTLVLEQ